MTQKKAAGKAKRPPKAAYQKNTENSAKNSEARARQLAGLKPFKPGQSGNPGGRPKHDIAAEIAEAIFAGNVEAITRAMAKRLRKGDEKVFRALADRAWGKPHQQVDVTGMNVNVIIDL